MLSNFRKHQLVKTREKNMTSQVIKIDKPSFESAVIEYIESVDRMQCHIHLRIDSEGVVYWDEDAGYCVSQDEFNRVPGHVRTVKHQQGHGQCNLSDDWTSTDDGMEEINATMAMIVEDLERDGFEVEVI